MSNNCVILIPEEVRQTKFYKLLEKRCGKNDTQIISYFCEVATNEGFKKGFTNWYKDYRKVEEVPTFDNINPRTIINDVIKYYYREHPDGKTTVMKDHKVVIGSYESASDRQECILNVRSELKDIAQYHEFVLRDMKDISFDKLCDLSIERMKEHVIQRICNTLGIDRKTLNTKLNQKRGSNALYWYYKDEQGPRLSKQQAANYATYSEIIATARDLIKDINTQDKNLLATLEEMIDYSKNPDGKYRRYIFFNKVFEDNDLYRYKVKSDEFNEAELSLDNSAIAISEGEEVSEDGVEIPLYIDETIKNYSSHLGEYSSFMLGISGSIQTYFNSLPVCRTTNYENGKYDYNVDNAIGLPTKMTARNVAGILYSRAKLDGNIQDFVNSIKTIAETTPGYEGLIKLYNDLVGYNEVITKADGTQETRPVPPKTAFAEELYDTFARAVFAKKEIYIDENGNVKARITNNMSSPRDSFILQLQRSVRYNAVRIEYHEGATRVVELRQKYNEFIKKLSDDKKYRDSQEYIAEKKALADAICNTFRWYYSNIDLSAILGFIDNNEHIDNKTKKRVIDNTWNINKLISLISDTVDNAKETKEKYESRQAKANIERYNNAIKQEQAESAGIELDASLLTDIDNIYKEEFVSDGTTHTAIEVADALLSYSTVKTQYNSRNAAGNTSSDVLNNNMLSFMKKLIENTANSPDNKLSPLQMFANYKFKTAQYDESNILIEHRNEDGKIINLGLFKKVQKQNPFNKQFVTLYEPTTYATDLLRVYLFNGANDTVKQKSALYAQMSRSDYLISSLASFYNPERKDVVENIGFADYYLRTPSDASHNFYISAPKHSIKGLFIIDDMSIIENDINRRVSELPKTNKYIGGSKSKIVDNTVFLKLLTGEQLDRIYLDDKMFTRIEEGNYAVITNRNSSIVIKGNIEKRGENSNYIHNIEVVGVLEDNNHKGLNDQVLNDYKEYYREKLKNNIIKIPGVKKDIRRINHNHPIFQQLFNVAKQEVTNAGLALTTLFEQHNSIDEVTGEEVTTFVDNDTLTWKGKFAESDDPDSMTEMYYHHDKGKPVFYRDKDGIIKLTGKVFTSDRFKRFSDIFEDENENKHYTVEANYLENLFTDGRAEVEDGHIHLLYGGANTHLHIDKNGNVEFTNAQRKYIQSRIDKFITDYVDATYNMITEYEEIIPESVPHDYEHVAEYILNYRLAYCAFADLFEGDTKSYKDFTDFFKRAKEVQGSGVPYSALDFTRPICEDRNLVKFSSLNENETIKALNDSKKLHDCYLYNTFRGITVYNTVRTSENTQTNLKSYLKEVIIKTYKENGINISEEAINNKVNDMMDGFKDIKTNDAQSYITLEEWIRRISMRGQLPKYLPLIERICDENIPLSSDDINEFIQVQKNFYYDLYNDRVTNHQRARQIKNAEFVLVPRLVKGTQLEEVYNAMIRHGIDQLNTVETSKAGKSNILTLWDNKGNLNEDWFDEKNEKFFNKVKQSIELFDYNFLYTQQETPQHINAENKASIQIMKRIVDNIPHYLNGKEHPLWQLKQKFYKCYAHNIDESNRDLLEKLGIKGKITDDANFSGLDAEVFLDMIRNELFRTSVDSELSDYATLNTSPVERIADFQSFGLDTVMPLIANYSIQRKLENSAQALFNNAITRQTLPGFHSAQITSVGWNNTKKATYFLNDKYKTENSSGLLDEISYKTWIKLSPEDRSKYIPDNGIGTSKDLKYHPALYKHKRTGITIKEEVYDTLSKDEQKSYEFSSSESYIEVRVPKNVFNLKLTDKDENIKSDNELLGELQKAGLDEFIGYRIPTEGKQSVAIMKVVGFVDDVYGSTIVVPDDWVAQTGSDFDIDSVYAIVFNNYIDKKGNIKKDKVKSKFKELDYISYINRRLHNKIQDIKEVKEAKQAIFDDIIGNQQLAYFNASEATSEAYNNLPDNVKDIVKNAQKKADNHDSYEFFLQQLNFVISDLNSYLDNSTINDEERNRIKLFIDSEENLLSIVKDNSEDLKSIHSKQSNYLKDIISKVEANAKKLNLPTYKEYLELDGIEKNTRKANTNELIQTMLDILRSDYSLEETLGQSNFREIKKAMKGIVSKRNSIAKSARSPYDFIAQADNMEDGISGLALKGVSVAYDNTISMCNNARPLLTYNNELKIVYDLDLEYPIDEKGNTEHKKLDIAELHKRFDTEEIDSNGQKYIKSNVEEILDEYGKPTGKVAITHKQYGWTNDNRNLFGFIITSYAAQTTAHQLDAVKEGKVPNVNLYTFGVYKMFPAIGSDYHTCIAFMNQPAISEIVNAYNMSKSIYVSGYTDPIQKAIVNIAKRIDSNIKYYSEAEALIEKTIKDNKLNSKFTINYSQLQERINTITDNNNLEQIVYDYNVVKQFEKLKQTSDAINAFGFVINPDKYGAKQTIFETNQVLTKIEDIILSDNKVFEDVENAKGERVHFLDAIFPGISAVANMTEDEGINTYLNTTKDENSICPPMNAFMRSATIPSIVINKRLFKTQSPKFRRIVEALEGVMSGKNPRISKETEDSFTNYIISYVTNNVDIISSPIQYLEDSTIFKVPTHNPVKDNDDVYFNRLKERNRIYGCNYGPNYKYRKGNDWIDFNPKDKEHLTQEEINVFLKFSPAQKVAYVQQLFSNSLAAKYLSVDLTTNNKRNIYNPDGQVITFDEEKYDINEVRNDFRDMFFNENPLMRLTALDLIKYAYVVEGRSRRRNLVSKIIPNEVLLEGINEGGTGIVDSLKVAWDTYIESNGQDTIDNMVENYIRSHSNMKEISQCTINSQDMEKYFGGYNTIDDMLQIYNTEENHDFLLSKGFVYDDYKIINGEKVLVPENNKYINITTYKNKVQVQTLYKIEKGPRLNQLILYPLNNLDPNEYDIVSSNPDNAKHYTAAYYRTILKKYNESNIGVEVKQTLSNYYSQNVTEEMKKQGTVKKVVVVSSPEVTKKLDIYSDKESIVRLRNRITEHFEDLTLNPLYLQNNELDNLFYGVSNIGINGHYEDIELYGRFYRITKERNRDFDKYKNPSISVLESDIEKKAIIESIRNYGGKFENIYLIRPLVTRDTTLKFSTVDETTIGEATNSIEKYINTLAYLGDETALQHFRSSRKTTDVKDIDINTNLEKGLINVLDWLHKEVNNTINRLEVFHNGHRMIDPEIFEEMLDNEALARSYVKTYLDATRLIDRFKIYDITTYKDDQKRLEFYVKELKKQIALIENNEVYQKAEKLYVTEYLAKKSGNPNIKNNIISLYEGFHKVHWLDEYFNDLQDQGNPIIQIITSTVMADIRAKELYSKDVALNFEKTANELIKKAHAAGIDINFDKFIDKDGYWIDEFNDTLRTDLSVLNSNIDKAYKDYSTSKGTMLEKHKLYEKYLNAQYELEKWLLKNINREIEDNYYQQILQNKDNMRYDDGRFMSIYIQYEMLMDMKRSLKKQSAKDNSNHSVLEKQINNIERSIRNLVQVGEIDEFNNFTYKTKLEEITSDKPITTEMRINSYEEAEKLSTYISNHNAIEAEYIDYKERDSFRDILEHNMAIINRYEQIDPVTGIARYTATDLSAIPEYTNAKAWVRENVIFKYGLSTRDYNNMTDNDINKYLTKYYLGEIKEDSEDFKYVLAAASRYFSNLKGSFSNKNSKYKTIAWERNARDVDGVIDGTKFTEKDLRDIKAEQLEQFNISDEEENAYSERNIIHNDSGDDTIYNAKFYNKLKLNGMSNPRYQEIVKRINNILRKVYDIHSKKVKTNYLTESELEELLKQFTILKYNLSDDFAKDFTGVELLNYIQSISKDNEESPVRKKLGVNIYEAKIVAQFIEREVDFSKLSKEDKIEFDRQHADAERHGKDSLYLKLWEAVNFEIKPNTSEQVQNHLLWGHLKPKEQYMSKYVHVKRTAASRANKFAFRKVNTKYYEKASSDIISKYGKNSKEYKDWFELNHVYNPYTHDFEPLPCWTSHDVSPELKQEALPNFNMSVKSAREGHENPHYRKGLGYVLNYKQKRDREDISNRFKTSKVKRILLRNVPDDAVIPDGNYDSNIVLSEYEEDMKKLLQDSLIKLAGTESSRRWLTKRAPLRAKDREYNKPAWVVELLKTFGLTDTNTNAYWNGDTKIGYDVDYVPPMPMLSELTSKNLTFPPVRKDFKSNEAFEKALKEYEENEEQIREENKKIIQNRIDRDWVSVVKDFIMQAGHYNAVQDNKYKLYFGQLLLDDIGVYETRSDSHNKLKKQASLDNSENQKYKKTPDKNAREMYDNWLFRVIYDYYKQSQGIGGKIGNILQGFTSTSYMTINLRAGIANVLVGDASILGELHAKEYAAGKEWATSQLIWSHSILDFIANAYKDTASTKAGAVIKGMNIVDYSTLDGTITQVDMKKWSQIVNDLGFSINNAGEHLMQNGFMIAMMLSHRIIDNPNYGKPGEDEKICVNFAEYVADVREEIFREIATPEQIEEYETYVANIKYDANGAKNFAWFIEDPISKYMANHHLNKEQIKDFKEKIDNRKKELKEEFEKAPTLWDNLDINDEGYMTFASGSILESINTIKDNKEISDAYKILGEFKGRVISVNKKIHGNYGKLDSAKIEKHWLGRLAMQYHKHLPTGIAKRYRREGYFNEERGTIEKGMYMSIADFLSFPVKALRERNEIREDEAEALTGLQNIIAYIVDYFKYLSIYRNVMPDYERANLNRIKGNIVGVLVAIAGTLAARLAWDDDDDSIAYNLLIYEADRLASEAAMYTPFGMISEGKKLWSAPIAGQSIVTDCINIISTICGVIFEGEDYDPYYHTGRYAGRHKAGVYLERRIPYYRNYAMLRDIADSNHYYKLGSNILSFVPIDKIVDWMK